jgi:hypothetical protein
MARARPLNFGVRQKLTFSQVETRLVPVTLAILVAVALASCAQGTRPFLMWQICLQDQRGVDEFKRVLQAIALDQKLKYIDSSVETQHELKDIGASGPNMHSSGGLIFVGVESDDGLGLMAGNTGLNDYDVAVGFNGPDLVKAHAFADIASARLAQRWKLKRVPQDSGASPDPGCASK